VKSHNVTLTGTLDMAQNCPLWYLLATFSAEHSSALQANSE